MTCPLCGGRPLILVTIIRPAGYRYRRLRCSSCSHRWSTHTPISETVRTGRPGTLTTEQIRYILSAPDSSYLIARAFNVSPTLVQKIRRRENYSHIFPELPPWQPAPGPRPRRQPVTTKPRPRRASCINCSHYQGLNTACQLGHITPVVACDDFSTAPD
jgi:hypothetical protein